MANPARRRARFTTYAQWLFWITLFVILFGAVVRITGSGAGCGQHWPSCHGELVHLPKSVDTLIELTHRLTSGIDGLMTFVLVIAAFVCFPRGHLVRRASLLTLLFMISEALLGARLVLANLVGLDASLSRAQTMAAHLVNTSMLSASMVATWWFARYGRDPSAPRPARHAVAVRWIPAVWVAALVLLLVNTTGAITALGDTVFPMANDGTALGERLRADLADTAPFLRRVRSLHPILALGAAVYLVILAWKAFHTPGMPRRCAAAALRVGQLVVLQSVLGVVNIMLSAPGWMQVLHLAVATLLWVATALWWLELRWGASAEVAE